MSKSAKGTREKHGKNVATTSGNTRPWSEFRKSQWRGDFLVAVASQNTSRACSKR